MGAVLFQDSDECVEGVDVTLRGGETKLTVKTNNYGNIDSDGLTAGAYQLNFTAAGYAPKTIHVSIDLDPSDTYNPDIDMRLV